MESEGPGPIFGETFHEVLAFGDKPLIILVVCFERGSVPAHSGDPFPQRIRCLLDVPPYTLGGFLCQNLRWAPLGATVNRSGSPRGNQHNFPKMGKSAQNGRVCLTSNRTFAAHLSGTLAARESPTPARRLARHSERGGGPLLPPSLRDRPSFGRNQGSAHTSTLSSLVHGPDASGLERTDTRTLFPPEACAPFHSHRTIG